MLKINRSYLIWLVVSSVIVLWDSAFVLLRPRTLVDGDLHSLFSPYQLYIEIDPLYGNLTDRFVVVQSQCNLAEVTLNLLAVFLSITAWKAQGALVGLAVSWFTFWKTIIYLVYDSPHLQLAENTFEKSFFVFILPTSFWLIMPVYGAVSISRSMLAQSKTKAS